MTLTFIETLGFNVHPGIPVRYLSLTLVATFLVEEFSIIVNAVASMFLVELDCFSHDNLTSLLEIVTECFSELAALLRSNCLLCNSPCYLLMLPPGLSLAYFGCHVLALRVEESLEVTIFLGA
jgi:hypothetical protein